MNILFIIFSILLFVNAFHQTILTNKEAQSQTTNKCNIPLLKSYVHADLEEQSRSPLSLSPSQEQHCRQMTSTCCTEEEFTEIYSNVQNNVNVISNIGYNYHDTLETLTRISDEDLASIYDSFDQAPFNVEELRSVIKKIKENPDDAYHSWHNAYEYALRNGSGVVCGICVPENHESIKATLTDNSVPEFVVHVEGSECFDLINDIGAKYMTSFLNDAVWLYRLAYLMNSIYQLNHEFEQEYIQQKQEGGEFSFDRSQCKESDYFNENPEECTNLCRNLGIVNLNPFLFYSDMLATIFVIIEDFNGDNIYVKRMQDHPEERLESKTTLDHRNVSESQEETLSLEEYILKTKDTFDKADFLEGFHDIQLNLVHIPLVLDSEGWNTYQYGAYVFADDYENKWGNKEDREVSSLKSVSLENERTELEKKSILSVEESEQKPVSDNREGIFLLNMVSSVVLLLMILK